MVFKGAHLPQEEKIALTPPKLASGELLVEMGMSTICGSDLHTYEGRRSAPTPCVLGHEGVGRVVAVGSDGDLLRIGRRITWTLTDTCGRCLPCTTWNLPQKCHSLFKYGHAELGYNGCFASHLILRPGTATVNLPDSLPDAFVAPANCALATMVAVLEKVPTTANKVLIQGAGLLGIYGAALLRDRGVDNVIVSDPVASRLEMISKFGGRAISPNDEQEGNFDAVIEVAGVPEVVDDALRLLRPGGVLVLAGMVHEATDFTLRGVELVRGCITMIGVHNYAARHLEAGIGFLDRNATAYPWGELVSPPLPLSKLDDAFALSQTRQWARVSVVPDSLL
jgi:putative phosphonate catabolism associated alcohol dehydrogenase